jgi:hypothetical protein
METLDTHLHVNRVGVETVASHLNDIHFGGPDQPGGLLRDLLAERVTQHAEHIFRIAA